VAGELPEPDASALRAQITRDPVASLALAQAEELEAELRAEPLLPVPLSLVGRILAAGTAWGEPPRRIRPEVLLFRVAACALVAFLAWIAFSGSPPELGDMTPDARLVASIPGDTLREAVPSAWTTGGGLLPEAPLSGGTRSMREALGSPDPQWDADPLVTAMLLAGGSLLFLLGLAFVIRQHLTPARSGTSSSGASASGISISGEEVSP
jgi:hypothetical protein